MIPIEVNSARLRPSHPVARAGLIFLALWILPWSLAGSTPAPEFSPTPVLNRLRFQQEILDLKLRALRQPGSSSIRDRLAAVYLDSGQPEKAITLYRHAMVFEPSRTDFYHRRLAGIYRRLGRDEEAEVELELARESAPETFAQRRRRQLEAWEEEGREDLLLQQYRFLYWTEKVSRDRYLRDIARLLADRGKREEAEPYYRMLIDGYRERIKTRPSSAVDYHLRIAGIYEEMGDHQAAADKYRQAVELEGEGGSRALLQEADYYRSRGEPDRAIDLYREAQARPGADRSAISLWISTLLERAGRPDEARAELERVSELEDGEEGDAAIRLALLLERQGKLEEALDGYHALLSGLDSTRRARLWERIGRLLSRLDREEEATRAYREAFQLRETERGEGSPSAVYLEKAIFLAEKGKLEELAGDYSRQLAGVYRGLLAADPERADYYHRKLGDLLRDQEDYQQAAAHYRAWSSLAPDDPDPHYRLYRLYRDYLDNPLGAERHRERYRELRKKNRGSD